MRTFKTPRKGTSFSLGVVVSWTRSFKVCYMAKSLWTLDNGTTYSSWNFSGTRLTAGSTFGTLAIFDFRDPVSSSSLLCICKPRVHDGNIVKVFWVPPEYGEVVACIFADGTVSLWEEVGEGSIDFFFPLTHLTNINVKAEMYLMD